MIYIKEWFFNKIQSEHKNLHFFLSYGSISKETEKAYQVFLEYTTIDGEYEGEKLVWVPKSCTMTEEEYKKKSKNRKNALKKVAVNMKNFSISQKKMASKESEKA